MRNILVSFVVGIGALGCQADVDSIEDEDIGEMSDALRQNGKLTLRGRFRLTNNPTVVNGIPSTNAFGELTGHRINYRIACDITSDVVVGDPWGTPFESQRQIKCRTNHVRFSGKSAILNKVTASLEGRDLELYVSQNYVLSSLVGASGPEYFGFEMDGGVQLAVDANGAPLFRSLVVREGIAMLRRYTEPPFEMTDFSDGEGRMAVR